MKFLIFGCNGMAGHMVSLYLQERGHAVTGFARRPSNLLPVVTGDAHDLALVRKIMEAGGVDSMTLLSTVSAFSISSPRRIPQKRFS